jgi:hypothetical protein
MTTLSLHQQYATLMSEAKSRYDGAKSILDLVPDDDIRVKLLCELSGAYVNTIKALAEQYTVHEKIIEVKTKFPDLYIEF